MAAMDEGLPLSALLSRALVAFTMEIDNEAEHRMPHRTTDHGSTARTTTNLDGTRRWEYIRIEPDRAGNRQKSRGRMRCYGRPPQDGWRKRYGGHCFGVIETRWEERFDKNSVTRFRDALRALVAGTAR
jgi:hypothetical protein